tara:strand:+ start:7058 stop:7447 length:390 start_codon:yes stop_codon:yes gene_type:complete
MIMIWLMKVWEGALKLLEIAIKHWRITLVVIALITIYAHAVLASNRINALEQQVIGCQVTVNQYKQAETVLQQAVVKETVVAKQKVAETEKQKVVIDERIKYIYKTDTVSAEWATVLVPDTIADQLRNY